MVPPTSLGGHGLEGVEVSRGEAATMVMAHGCTPAGAALKHAAGSGCCSVAGTLLWSGARAGTRQHQVLAAYSSAAAGCSTASTCRRCNCPSRAAQVIVWPRSEEHTSALQSLMRNSYAVL